MNLSLRFKVYRIKKNIRKIVSEKCIEPFWITWYGAIDINPNNLVFLIAVKTDKQKEKLLSDSLLLDKIIAVLFRYKYPYSAINEVQFWFESQENVDKVSSGNWHNHIQ